MYPVSGQCAFPVVDATWIHEGSGFRVGCDHMAGTSTMESCYASPRLGPGSFLRVIPETGIVGHLHSG